MTVFTGRLDQYDDEIEMVSWFWSMLEQFDADDALLVFEDQTKTGLPCKPHYHFIMKTNSNHDTIRRWMSLNLELKGTNSSLKSTEEYDKAMYYILKQYPIQKYIPFSDLDQDQLNYWIKLSSQHNQQIKLNTWPDHLEEIVKGLKEKFPYNPERYDIYLFIIKYVINWNRDPEKRRIEKPTNMNKTIQYIESYVLSEDEQINRFMMDNQQQCYVGQIFENQRNNNKTYSKTYAYYGDSDISDEEKNI